jgi:hypothetical protein
MPYPESAKWMPAFAETCKSIVIFFNNHHVLKSELTNAQLEEKIKRLAMPGTIHCVYYCVMNIFFTLLLCRSNTLGQSTRMFLDRAVF